MRCCTLPPSPFGRAFVVHASNPFRVGLGYARGIRLFVCLYATPRAVWSSLETLTLVFDRRLHLFSEKNFASVRVLHPYERLVEARKNIV